MKNTFKSLFVIVGLVMSSLFVVSCDPTVEPPEQGISLEEAKMLESEFLRTRYGAINEALPNIDQDTRDFWFSIDTLKDYIAYVEQEAGAQGLDNLGIRIYYGAYPEGSEYPDPGYATVFLVPTTQSTTNVVKQGFGPMQDDDDNDDDDHDNIDGIYYLNYGTGGRPPNDL